MAAAVVVDLEEYREARRQREEAIRARIRETRCLHQAAADDLSSVESCTCHTGCFLGHWCRCMVCH